MEKTRNWLLVFNCTNIGLANCMKLLAPGVEVDSIDFGRFLKDYRSYAKKFDDYDLILTAPHFLRNECVDFTTVGRVRTIPVPYFDAYHPDLCYLTDGTGFIKGPMGDYHSKIITAAHRKGLPKARVRSLFDRHHFERFGYFTRWEPARARLLREFSEAGFDVSRQFRNWSLRGPFMHSVNHPSIEVVHDIARCVLASEGLVDNQANVLPPDNLLNGAVFPIYPDVAEHLSVAGSYQFKLAAQFRCMGLDGFIDASYDLLSGLERRNITAHSGHQPSLQRVMDAL